MFVYIHTAGISVDWISDKLYYLDSCNDYIGVVDLATKQYKILVSNINARDRWHYYYSYGTNSIVVDPTTRLVHALQKQDII